MKHTVVVYQNSQKPCGESESDLQRWKEFNGGRQTVVSISLSTMIEHSKQSSLINGEVQEWFGISYDNGVVGIDKDERCINFCKLRCGSLADALLTDNEVDIDGLD
ncbi:uncharacterized protein LOC144452348 [Glandiceps talaboti]